MPGLSPSHEQNCLTVSNRLGLGISDKKFITAAKPMPLVRVRSTTAQLASVRRVSNFWCKGSKLGRRQHILLQACHAREVIERAFVLWGAPEIVNTDQGSQFTATEFTDVALGQGCQLSMDGGGAWRDNVLVVRLWRSVKYECVHLKAYDDVSAARAGIADHMGWYNAAQAHSRLGDLTPDEHYFANLPAQSLAV